MAGQPVEPDCGINSLTMDKRWLSCTYADWELFQKRKRSSLLGALRTAFGFHLLNLRPDEAVMRMDCFLLVPKSFADTCRMSSHQGQR